MNPQLCRGTAGTFLESMKVIAEHKHKSKIELPMIIDNLMSKKVSGEDDWLQESASTIVNIFTQNCHKVWIDELNWPNHEENLAFSLKSRASDRRIER